MRLPPLDKCRKRFEPEMYAHAVFAYRLVPMCRGTFASCATRVGGLTHDLSATSLGTADKFQVRHVAIRTITVTEHDVISARYRAVRRFPNMSVFQHHTPVDFDIDIPVLVPMFVPVRLDIMRFNTLCELRRAYARYLFWCKVLIQTLALVRWYHAATETFRDGSLVVAQHHALQRPE